MKIYDEVAAQIGNEVSKMENLTSLRLDFS
jgi:hypothetical protein